MYKLVCGNILLMKRKSEGHVHMLLLFFCVCVVHQCPKRGGNKSNIHRITHRSLVYKIMTVAQIIFALRTY